jgi:hypothetical protein
MRKLAMALVLGSMMAAAAAPALAQESDARRIGEHLRGRITDGDRDDRRDDRRERRDDRQDEQRRRWENEQRRDDQRQRWEDERRRDDERRRWDDEQRRRWEAQRDYERRYGRDRYENAWGRNDPWRDRDFRDGYPYGGTPWNREWTPYGFGYNDSFTRDWVLRNFADSNRNGRISDKEWRRAQNAFYQLADRNRDGRISRSEYDWALRTLHYQYGYR